MIPEDLRGRAVEYIRSYSSFRPVLISLIVKRPILPHLRHIVSSFINSTLRYKTLKQIGQLSVPYGKIRLNFASIQWSGHR